MPPVRRNAALLAVVAVSLAAVAIEAKECTYRKPGCTGEKCVTRWECSDKSECGRESGCVCPPCYGGSDCSQYVDKFPIALGNEADEVHIPPNHKGSVYKVSVEDKDQTETCRDVAKKEFFAKCPCGAIEYGLELLRPSGTQSPFTIDPVTGQVSTSNTAIEAGQTYYLRAVLSPYRPVEQYSPQYVNITIMVGKKQEIPKKKEEEETKPSLAELEEDEPGSAFLHTQTQPRNSTIGAGAVGQVKSRKKRFAPGAGSASAEMTLTEVTTPAEPINPGQTIDYILNIDVPQLSTAMDLLVEIFVMDAVSGITPFAICAVSVETIGNLITDGAGTTLLASNFQPVTKENAFFTGAVDRATINFGSVKNTATVDAASTDRTDSRIVIKFGASLIPNTNYQNNSAVVTVGAEYDSDNYVWVSQASYNFLTSLSYSYPSNVVIAGPNTAAVYSGATFTIEATISDPVGPFKFEVYTPDKIHNKFTVSNMAILSVGENLKCTGEPKVETEYFFSVDRKTYHRAVSSFDFIMTGLVYPNLADELNDVENKISLTFTVFFVDAKDTDIVSVGAGITAGATTLWTSLINVTMTAPAAAPDETSTVVVTKRNIGSTSREVSQYGVLTYGADIKLDAGKGAKVECTASPPADHKITGVMWGKAGGNIALRPNLTDSMTHDDTMGVTAWSFHINSTGQITGDAAADTATLEISVQYLSTSPAAVTVTCGGTPLTLDGAVNAAGGTSDISGTADAPVPGEVDWFLGGQAALVAKLKFPAGGKAYSDMVLETSGDFDVTAFGAQVCRVEIMRAGLGVPTIGGKLAYLNSMFELQKISASSFFDDGTKLTIGPIAGVDRGTEMAEGDEDVIIRMTYIIPKNQTTVSAVTYNMSMGIQLDTNLIWTGWTGFSVDAGAPAHNPIIIAKTFPPDTTTIEVGKPTMTQVNFKMPPGKSDIIKITATSTDSATLYVCRIILIAIGDSYPCTDKEPYGKDKIDFAQPNTIIHDAADWGKEAVLDFGVLTNVGYQEYFPDEIADSDSIVVGILTKGVVAGSADLTVTFTHGAATITPTTTTFTVTAPLTYTATPVTAVWVPAMDANTAYNGMMKIVDLVVTVPDDYGHKLEIVITNNDPAAMKLCFAAVAAAGKNVPCVIPHMIIPTVVEDDTKEEYTISLLETCFYPIVPGDITENTITIRAGVQLTKGSVGGKLEAAITEDATAVAGQPSADFDVTPGGDYPDPTNLNTTTEGFLVELVDDTTTKVKPGSSMFYGLKIILPADTTGQVEIGAMAPTDGGRAYATLHSVRWGDESGKNVGCMMDPETNYEINLLQNSSLNDPMIHESQTDTLVAKIGYLTNTGLSYMQNFPTEPDDNAALLEVEIMMADHTNATNTNIIPVSIAVKFGTVIYVVTKNLEIERTAGADLMMLRTELNFTETPTSTIFSKAANPTIPMTFRVSHFMNESRQELNTAVVRVLLPKPVQFVDGTDTEVCNVTSYNFTNSHYLDFDISNLFFTDYLELNVTVSVDPNNDMIKGLGLIDAAALVRLVCTTFDAPSPPRYCGTTAVLPFQIDGTECFDPLNIKDLADCSFSASTVISSAESADKVRSTATGEWSPAVRSGPGWNHYITIDFLKKTRVTQIKFQTVAGKRSVDKFKLAYSYDGLTFMEPCSTEIEPTAGVAQLPSDCRFEARFGRLIIVDTDPANTGAFGVKFVDWEGCPMETTVETCKILTTVDTSVGAWRQADYDAHNSIFYFCDYSPSKGRTVCFSTSDGAIWNALPAYIGSLVGPANDVFYAKDTKGTATVSSKDGINWIVVSTTVASGLTATAVNIPGKPSADLTTAIPIGTGSGYEADFTGIKKGTNYVAKWESCCS